MSELQATDDRAVAHRALWMGLLDMARWVRYYEFLHSRSRSFRNVTRILLAGFSTGAVVFFLGAIPLPPYGLTIVGLSVAVLAIMDMVSDPSTKTATLSVVTAELHRLENEYRRLWEYWLAGRLDLEEAQDRAAELTSLARMVTDRVGGSVDENANRRSAEIVYEVEFRRYAG